MRPLNLRSTGTVLGSSLVLVGLAGWSSTAEAGVVVDSDACVAQVKQVARLDVDCALKLSFDATGTTGTAAAILTVLSGSQCSLPVKFAKRDLYDTWISETAIQVRNST